MNNTVLWHPHSPGLDAPNGNQGIRQVGALGNEGNHVVDEPGIDAASFKIHAAKLGDGDHATAPLGCATLGGQLEDSFNFVAAYL